MDGKLFGLPFVAVSAICLALSFLYLFVWPKSKAVNAKGARF